MKTGTRAIATHLHSILLYDGPESLSEVDGAVLSE